MAEHLKSKSTGGFHQGDGSPCNTIAKHNYRALLPGVESDAAVSAVVVAEVRVALVVAAVVALLRLAAVLRALGTLLVRVVSTNL